MRWTSAFAIYFVLWWLSLFLVLPFGVRSQLEAGKVAPGTDPGSPARVHIARVLLGTSVLSALLLAAFIWLIVPLLVF